MHDTPSPTPSRRQLLNPLIFPAETNGRFQMIIVGIVLLSLYVAMNSILVLGVSGNSTFIADLPWVQSYQEHVSSPFGKATPFDLTDQEIKRLSSDLLFILRQAIVNSLPRLGFMVLSALAPIAISYALYHSHPSRLSRRQRLKPLTAFDNPERADEVRMRVAAIAASAGISSPPAIVIKSHDYSDAQVFGLRHRYVLRLNARRLSKRLDELADLWIRSQKAEFRALVLHELGHIANGDIGRSYFTSVLWKVFLGLIIVPFILLMSIQPALLNRGVQIYTPRWSVPVLILQGIALIFVVRAIQRSLLRIREFYADWRVIVWGAGPTLMRMLVASETGRRAEARQSSAYRSRMIQRWGSRFAGWWYHMWRFHTPLRERYYRLANPSLLFNISADLPFLTGALLACTLLGLSALLLPLISDILVPIFMIGWALINATIDLPVPLNRILFDSILVSIVIFLPNAIMLMMLVLIAYLVAGSLGRQVQRAAIADLLPELPSPGGYGKLLKIAILFAAGLEFGIWIIPADQFIVQNVFALILTPIWLMVFTTLTWFWLVYTRLLTRLLIGSHFGDRFPRFKHWAVTISSIAVLWMLYLPILFARVGIAAILILIDPVNVPAPASLFVTPSMTSPFVVVTFGLFALGLLLFTGWSLLTLGAALGWRQLSHHRCPTCRQAIRNRIAVGQFCPFCYGPLAPWLYVEQRRAA